MTNSNMLIVRRERKTGDLDLIPMPQMTNNIGMINLQNGLKGVNASNATKTIPPYEMNLLSAISYKFLT